MCILKTDGSNIDRPQISFCNSRVSCELFSAYFLHDRRPTWIRIWPNHVKGQIIMKELLCDWEILVMTHKDIIPYYQCVLPMGFTITFLTFFCHQIQLHNVKLGKIFTCLVEDILLTNLHRYGNLVQINQSLEASSSKWVISRKQWLLTLEIVPIHSSFHR